MNDVLDYLIGLELLEASGLVFGLLAVYFLIKENIRDLQTFSYKKSVLDSQQTIF